MFDIGFGELFIIGVVALVVIGPERLPRVARTAGHLFGRMQRYVSQVKSDISREMDAADLAKVKTEFESAARTFKADVEAKASEVERDMREAQQTIEQQLATPADGSAPSPDAPSPQLELGIDPSPPAQPTAAPPAKPD